MLSAPGSGACSFATDHKGGHKCNVLILKNVPDGDSQRKLGVNSDLQWLNGTSGNMPLKICSLTVRKSGEELSPLCLTFVLLLKGIWLSIVENCTRWLDLVGLFSCLFDEWKCHIQWQFAFQFQLREATGLAKIIFPLSPSTLACGLPGAI